jgi:hypothetical protein
MAEGLGMSEDDPSGNLSFTKRTLVEWMSGSWTQKGWIALSNGLWSCGRESFWLKAFMIWEGEQCPFWITSSICLTTDEKHGEPQLL